MTGIWLYSYVTLWVAVLALAWLTLSLLRLVGQLHQRLGPAGAAVTRGGLEIGERLPDVLEANRIVDNVLFSFPKKKDSLLVFVSAGCSACEDLLPSLIPFARREWDRVETIAVGTNENVEGLQHYSAQLSRGGIGFLASPELARALRVSGSPYAMWIDVDGKVCAKGIVNHSEHLESLKNACESGFETAQQHREEAHHGRAMQKGA